MKRWFTNDILDEPNKMVPCRPLHYDSCRYVTKYDRKVIALFQNWSIPMGGLSLSLWAVSLAINQARYAIKEASHPTSVMHRIFLKTNLNFSRAQSGAWVLSMQFVHSCPLNIMPVMVMLMTMIIYTLGTFLSCEAMKGSKERTMDDKVKNNESHLLRGGLSHEML